MAGLAKIFGSGAMTNSIWEIEGMEVIFIIGSNTKETHPVVANRMIKAHRKGARIIIADPRTIPMAKFADIHLKIRPGSDIALLNGMARIIVDEGLTNEEFIREKTEGYEIWKRSLELYTPEYVETITGVPREDITRAARLYGASRRAGIFYTMGITQHACGTDNVMALANLVSLTGNIGRPFTGINPLRGQNNVQGASDAACLPNVYPGYQRVDDPDVRKKFEQAWGVTLSPTIGMTSTVMMNAAAAGTLKAMYIMGENPLITDPNMHHTIKSLQNLEFLVVQDIFLTETAKLADVVLPAACSFEKNGTFTNTERKVQRIRRAVSPPGMAKDDLWIISEIAKKLRYQITSVPEKIFEEYSKLWHALSGMSYTRLEKYGLCWPCPTPDHPGTPYLYKDGFAKGRVPFIPVAYQPPAEVCDSEYPFVLTTGRNLFQYHSGSMTRRVGPIEAHAGKPYVEINPYDSGRLGIHDGDAITVVSRRGEISISARVTPRVQEGTVFVPMHYREAAANVVTNDALDPVVKIPELKVCAVKIIPAGASALKGP